MNKKLKPEGLSPEFMEAMLLLTQQSPLLAVGTVQARYKRTGRSEKGDWTIFTVEVRGRDGKMVQVTVTEPVGIPPVGEFIVLPVFVSRDGYLREARQLSHETF